MVKLTKTVVPKLVKVGKKNNQKTENLSRKNVTVMKKSSKVVKLKESVEKSVQNVSTSPDLRDVKKNINKVNKNQVKLITKKPKTMSKTLKSGKENTKKIKNHLVSLQKKASEENSTSTSQKNRTGTEKLVAPRVSKSEVRIEARRESQIKRKKSVVSEEPVKKKLKNEKSLKGKQQLQAQEESEHSADEDDSTATISPVSDAQKALKLTDDMLKKVGNLEVTKDHVKECVKAAIHLAKKSEEGKTSLLPTDTEPIFLQVNCIKVPKVPRRQLRIYLPHMMVGPTDEVALFVGDLERGRRRDYEKTVDYWETKLREANVTRIKEVIPLNKVKTEYSQYEMKLKLARLFDFFLVDGKITGHMTHLLGKTFRKAARPPTPVKLHRDNLQSEIDNALRKTAMEIHGFGNCHTVQVASVSMPEEEIVENVIAACKALENDYPGGWTNIRSILMKTTKSIGIPVYFSMQNKNQVPVANIKSKRPKAYKTVEGELSTISSNAVVRVTPLGKVIVKKIKKIKEDKSKDEESK